MKGYSENYWAKRAKQYNKTNWVKNENFMVRFLGMLPDKKYEPILEVGIGTGAVAEKVCEKIGPLTGIDISKEMISQIDHPEITPILGNAHCLPFDDSYCDKSTLPFVIDLNSLFLYFPIFGSQIKVITHIAKSRFKII